MKYEDVFNMQFIEHLNNILGENTINPKEEFGQKINIENILNKIHYQIEKDNYEKSGHLNSKDRVIKIDSREVSTRQRFTLAHELGHIIQGKAEASRNHNSDDYSPNDRQDEVFANNFAAQFLMPKALLQNTINMSISTLKINPKRITSNQFNELIKDVANSLEVSTQALEIRVSNLKLFRKIEE